MKKNILRTLAAISASITLLLLVIPIFSVSADSYSSGVFDLCTQLTGDEKSKLEKQAADTSKQINMHVAVVIINDLGSKTPMVYADDFYDEKYGINTDGVLLLINLDTGVDWISTSGTGLNYYSDARIDKMFDEMEAFMKIYDCYNESRVFLENCVSFYKDGIPDGHYIYDDTTGEIIKSFGKKYNFAILGFGAIFGVTAAAISVGVIVSSYKLHAKTSATVYTSNDNTVFTAKDDRFLREYTTKSKIETSSGGGGRSGGGSSSHRSSSGGRHGGGGRGR